MRQVGEADESGPTWLTTAEVAELLRVTPRTIENMRLEKRGPPYLLLGAEGIGRVVYNLRDVMAWVGTLPDW